MPPGQAGSKIDHDPRLKAEMDQTLTADNCRGLRKRVWDTKRTSSEIGSWTRHGEVLLVRTCSNPLKLISSISCPDLLPQSAVCTCHVASLSPARRSKNSLFCNYRKRYSWHHSTIHLLTRYIVVGYLKCREGHSPLPKLTNPPVRLGFHSVAYKCSSRSSNVDCACPELESSKRM